MHAETVDQGKHIGAPRWLVQITDHVSAIAQNVVCTLDLFSLVLVEMQAELQVVSHDHIIRSFGNRQNLSVNVKFDMEAASVRIAPIVTKRRIESPLIKFNGSPAVLYIHLHQSSLHTDSPVQPWLRK